MSWFFIFRFWNVNEKKDFEVVICILNEKPWIEKGLKICFSNQDQYSDFDTTYIHYLISVKETKIKSEFIDNFDRSRGLFFNIGRDFLF